jgi:glycosyltransferase involved in cell wall biosynthesis
MKYPFFSVIIPVYNRGEIVHRAIESVLSQSYVHFEVIIVNDGSTDSTKNVIMSYIDNRIKIVDTENRGVSHARNRGIEKSNGDYVAFLDSDDQFLPNKLQEDSEYINKHPESLIHQSDEVWIRNGIQVNKKILHEKIVGYIFQESLEMCIISPSSVVIKKELFDFVGYFDEKMRVCEDYDLWLRITHTYPVGLIPKKTIIKYGGHSDQLSRSVVAIDRFRIYSMLKLLNNCKLLSEDKIMLVKQKVEQKCLLVYNGAKKRGNLQLESICDEILSSITQGSTFPRFESLLKI